MKKIFAIVGIAMILCSFMIIPASALIPGISIEPYIPLNISIEDTHNRYTYDMGLTGVINEGMSTSQETMEYGATYEEWGETEQSIEVYTTQEITKVTDIGYKGYVRKSINHYYEGENWLDLRVDRIYTNNPIIIDTERKQEYSGVIKDSWYQLHGEQKVTYIFEFRYQELKDGKYQWVDELMDVEVPIINGNVYTVPKEVTTYLKEKTGKRYVLCKWYWIQMDTDSDIFEGSAQGTIEYQCNFANNGNTLRLMGFQEDYMKKYTSTINTSVNVADFDFSNFIVDGVAGFMTRPLFGDFTIGGLMAVILGIGLCLVLIKIYLGG